MSVGQCSKSCFQRDLLPSPRSFFEWEVGRLTRPNGKGWAQGNCPFHQSKSSRSLAVNVETGGWHCFGCDSHGDLVGFVMQRDQCSFKDACKQLGAWRAEGNKPSKPIPHRLAPWLVLDAVVDGVQYRASVRDEPRNYADKIRRFYREASDRMVELSHGDSETYAGEQESCWDRMACALDELRELETV